MIERYAPQDVKEIWSDESKFKRFTEIEVLSCEALAREKVIPQSAAVNIRKKAKISVKKIEKIEQKTHHDIVAFVLNLSESLGEDAQYIHFGLTSSDLLDTTLAWQIKDVNRIILKELTALICETKKQSLKYKDTVCVGRTHGVHSEVFSFGLKFALFYDELTRIGELLKESETKVCCGKVSGAVGTFAHISPRVEEYICKKIGIKNASISTQIVGRDRLAYYMHLLSLLGSVIERFAIEIRHLQKTETKEAEEPFYKGQKGSSAMPHKRNPIICERMCGLARLLRANALVSLENVALWHERDISHSSSERVVVPDSTMTVVYMLRKFIKVVKGLNVYPQNMLTNLEKTQGLIFSQNLLLRLMQKGLVREKAYDLVQNLSFEALKNKSHLKEELLKSKKLRMYLAPEEVEEAFSSRYYLRNVDKIYKRLGIL
jgi:adenylosuccinate lyase